MPCFLTQQIQVDLTKVDPNFVLDALRGLQSVDFAGDGDYAVVSLRDGESVVYRGGKLTIQTRNTSRATEIENEVKRGISNAVLQAASKRFRWTLKSTKENEYVVEKRGF